MIIEFLLFTLLCVSGALGLAVLLRRWRPLWAVRRTALISAAPLPMLLILLCLFMIGNAATASREACGIDACGMAIMFGFIGLFYAIGAFAIAAVASARLLRYLNRK